MSLSLSWYLRRVFPGSGSVPGHSGSARVPGRFNGAVSA